MSEVEVRHVDGVSIIAINRPQARNAVNFAVAQQIAAAIDELESRDDLRIGVLTGNGGSFCAGMDLKAFLRGEVGRVEGRGFAGLTESLPTKPLIAAVEGHVLAGGFELALACDLIVASSASSFGLPEVKRALTPSAGGLLRLPRQLPYRIAMQLVLTGDPMTARELAAFGLLNKVVEPGTALDEALQLAKAIARNGPLAIKACKKVLMAAPDWSQAEMFPKQREITGPVFASEDAKEGARAFAEKRAPAWNNR
ncbi:MAG TPA: crotonase/enoyl-CoA hydratase family protein [Ramlibacter sp.]|uniref:crotonase/enoyl-CoA hydratase family protein n=1 Tax=Ramlibacter sp. TaxID=1917967 RepID=UPI002BDC1220|nr:crotonase/enoyl-CoA hydratase family protein [Ramlibacter sp.]HVZ45789.1 crotonase/enoyl-CoA hydratase family protein [Ramlibacter sp.]